MATNSDIFVLEFSGSNSIPGRLHRILYGTHTVVSNINNNLPLGGSNFVRATDGRFFIGGGDFRRTQVYDIDPSSGTTRAIHYEGPGNYSHLLGVDHLGRNYILTGRSVARVDHQSSEGVFQNLSFVPQTMAFSLDESIHYLASENYLGGLEGGGYRPFDLPPNTFVTNLVTDLWGNLFAILSHGATSYDCQIGFAPCNASIINYHHGDTRPYQIRNLGPSLIQAMAFDFQSGELVVVTSVDQNASDYHCAPDQNFVVLRIRGSGDTLVADAAPSPAAGGEGQGMASGGSSGTDSTSCPEPIQCGPGTTLVGSRCLPTIFVDCQEMWNYCMTACDVVEVPRLGWGPCTQACYASQDYCEDHFQTPSR